MGTPTIHRFQIAASVRLILAMFRIIAGIEEGFGKAVLDILRKQYPDQDVNASPGSVGSRLLGISRKQNQGDDERAMDALQDFLTYISVGANGGKGWDFAKDFDTWQKALDAIYSNVRTRAMTKSIENQKRRKREKSIDDAYGTRGEGGGDPEGGEARMPTPDENSLSKSLDDQAAVKQFVSVLDERLPELKESLSEDTRKLFDLIYEDGVGGFGSDIKDNMNQATEFMKKHPELYEKNSKRWSGYVGDLRKKLLTEILDFVDTHLDRADREVLRDQFFTDTTPAKVRQLERDKSRGKLDYQQGLDERKLSRWKWKAQNGGLTPAEQTSYGNLEKKLRAQGVDVDSIQPMEKPDAKSWQLHSKAASALSLSNIMLIAARVAAKG